MQSNLKVTITEPPTTLDAALTMIEQMRLMVEGSADIVEKLMKENTGAKAALTTAEGKIETLIAQRDYARSERDDAKEKITELAAALGEQAHDLACIRQKVKAGRIEDAVYDLDKVLGEVDHGHKARTTAVAVML